MSKRILIRGARQLLTLQGFSGPRRGPMMSELGIIEDGAVLIVDGVIEEVGTSRRVENVAGSRDAVEIGAEGRVVMPGFVDSRTHLVSGPPLLDEFEIGIRDPGTSDTRPPGAPSPVSLRAVGRSSRKRMEMVARKVLKEFVRNGTTTLEARSGLGVDEKTELKILRALNSIQRRPLDLEVTFYGAASLGDGFAHAGGKLSNEFLAHILTRIRRLRLARFVDVPLGRNGFPAEKAKAYLRIARTLGFETKVTAAPDAEVETVVEVAEQTGAVSIDYLVFDRPKNAEVAARASAVTTLLPGAGFHRIPETYPPARPLIDAGAAVAIASGYSADLCPSASMPAILSVACRRMRMSPAEALTAATINGAHALGQERRIGSLEIHKEADIIMLNVPDYREISYRFGMNQVAMIMKRGDVIYPRMEFPWTPR